MGASGLLEIKRRINSVKNTQKITKAMGLISISKLRKAKDKLYENDKYFCKFNLMKENIFYMARNEKNLFLDKNSSNKKLIIVLASNSGLCGSFNGQGFSYINEKYEKEKDNIKLIAIGQRGLSYIKKYNFNLYKSYKDLDNSSESKHIKEIILEAMELYSLNEIGEFSIVYTKYESAIKQSVVEETIFPFDKKEVKEEGREVFITDTELEDILENFIYRYAQAKVINCIFHSKTSEQSIRMQTMSSATKNADEILKNLNSKYNKIRQSAITQEISEIVSGANFEE